MKIYVNTLNRCLNDQQSFQRDQIHSGEGGERSYSRCHHGDQTYTVIDRIGAEQKGHDIGHKL